MLETKKMILNQQPKCPELSERGQLLLAAFPIEENRNGVYVLIRVVQPNVNYFLFILTLILTKKTQNFMGWLLRQSNIREKLTKYLRRRARPT